METQPSTPINDNLTKKCPLCGFYKPKRYFYASTLTGDGLSWYCRHCRRERERAKSKAKRDACRAALDAAPLETPPLCPPETCRLARYVHHTYEWHHERHSTGRPYLCATPACTERIPWAPYAQSIYCQWCRAGSPVREARNGRCT